METNHPPLAPRLAHDRCWVIPFPFLWLIDRNRYIPKRALFPDTGCTWWNLILEWETLNKSKGIYSLSTIATMMDGCSKGYFSEFTAEKMFSLDFICVQKINCMTKGGDIWTGKGLSQGIKHVRSLQKENNVEMEGERGIFGELDKWHNGRKEWHSGMGCQPFSATKAHDLPLVTQQRWKGKNMSPGSNALLSQLA